MTLAEVASATGLARPTARRILLTLAELGYVRAEGGEYALTPRVLDLGVAYVRSQGLWDVARPHMEGWSPAPTSRARSPSSTARTSSTSRAWPSPRSSAFRCRSAPGSRRCHVAGEGAARRAARRGARGRARPAHASGLVPRWQPDDAERDAALREVRARGWALTDEQLALGIRSVAAPLRDGSGRVIAAVNVNVHAAETSVDGSSRSTCRCCCRRPGRSAPTSPGGPPCRTSPFSRF